jgi:tetratricopeptide (TPR) repeat protein
MPSSEPEDETRPAPAEPTPAPAKADEPAWPPVEARPEEAPASVEAPASAAAPAGAEAPAGVEAAAPAATDEPLLTKPEEPVRPKGDEPAAEPNQEMGLSESTLHWLVDGEKAVEPLEQDPATAPHYDPAAAVAGRRRTVAVIGGAAVLAFVVAAVLHGQASRNRTAEAPQQAAEPAAVLTQRAEAALAQGRAGEAMDLARLAIVTDARSSDAYIIIGKVQRDSGRPAEARAAFREYLQLAPIGTHAEEARAALASLPP